MAEVLPLTGIVVVDLSRFLAGPYPAMLLGDLGADVVKIEEPGVGDESRTFGPPFAGGESAYYLCLNRNKRSIALNLKVPAGLQVFEDLIAKADILIENFRPGVMARLGVDSQRLEQLNPRLVHCSITAYGADGPYRDRPGFDFIIQAASGLMSITGEPDGEPMKVGLPTSDTTTGLLAAIACLASLRERDRTGRGQRVDLSLFDAQLHALLNVAQSYLISGEAPRRYGNAHPDVLPYGSFRCRDGYIAIGVATDAQFARFAVAVELPEMVHDPRFATIGARRQHREVVDQLVTEALMKQGREEWLEVLTAAEVPCGPIHSIPEAFDLPQARDRRMVVESPHPTGSSVRLVRSPYLLNGKVLPIRRHPPSLGEHTGEILRDLLHYSEAKLRELAEDGAI